MFVFFFLFNQTFNYYFTINTISFSTDVCMLLLQLDGAGYQLFLLPICHIKPPKLAMASLSQSESESLTSCGSAAWIGEKWLKLSPMALACWYWR